MKSFLPTPTSQGSPTDSYVEMMAHCIARGAQRRDIERASKHLHMDLDEGLGCHVRAIHNKAMEKLRLHALWYVARAIPYQAELAKTSPQAFDRLCKVAEIIGSAPGINVRIDARTRTGYTEGDMMFAQATMEKKRLLGKKALALVPVAEVVDAKLPDPSP